MIPASSFLLDGDTALVVVECPPDSAPAAWEQADKPCDSPDCQHTSDPLPFTYLDEACLESTDGRTIEGGYRRLGDGRLVHRVAWEQAHGPIPDGMVVMHLCDNPPCCHPNHMQLGTRAENNADRDRKGRNRRPNQRGEAHSNAKLSDDDVATIRASDEPATVLGPRYDVNPDHIRRIRRGDARTKKATCPDCNGTGRHTFTVEYATQASPTAYDIKKLRVHVIDVPLIVDTTAEMIEHWDDGCVFVWDDKALYVQLEEPVQVVTLPPDAARLLAEGKKPHVVRLKVHS